MSDNIGIDDPFESLEENIQDWNYAPPKAPEGKKPTGGLPSVGKKGSGFGSAKPIDKMPSGNLTKGSSKSGNRGSKLDAEIIDDEFDELSDYWD